MVAGPRAGRRGGPLLALLVALPLLITGCGASAPETMQATTRSPSAGTDTDPGARPSPPGASERPSPTAVRIPAIEAASELIDLGIATDGSLQTPQDFDLAGWFTGGGRPGGTGPTVIAGHVDSTAGPAVFFRLRDLEPGDVVEVDLAGGGQARYAVTRTEQYPKDEFPTFAVFGATPADELRLVTCTGEFDRGARSYLDNLVVYAERLPD